MCADDSKEKETGNKLGTDQTVGPKAQEPESSLAGVHSTGVTVEDLEIAFEDLVTSYAKTLGPGVRVRIAIHAGTTKQDNIREVLVHVVLRVGKKEKKVAKGYTVGEALRLMLDAEGAGWATEQRDKQRDKQLGKKRG